jgi:hypothetical protein
VANPRDEYTPVHCLIVWDRRKPWGFPQIILVIDSSEILDIGPEGSASTTFETMVEERQFWDLLDYVNLVGLPLLVIAILFFIVSRRA